MSLSPSGNFWPQPVTIDIQGVTAANAPLHIASATISIDQASPVNEGTVTTGAQSYAGAKTLLGGLALATGPVVTAISIDGTLSANSDAAVPTEKAVKTYVDAHAEASTATPPVYVTGTDISLRNSAAATVTSISTDATLVGNSDLAVPTEKAVKGYVDTRPAAGVVAPLFTNGSAAIELRNTSGSTINYIVVTSGLIPAPLHTRMLTEASTTNYVINYVGEHCVTQVGAPFVWSVPNGTLRLGNDAFQYVTAISTDGALAANTDASLSTQKAIKTYVDTHSPVTAASLPLSIASGTISVAPASATATGVVTTGAQTMAGFKTFTGGMSIANVSSPQLLVGYNLSTQATVSVTSAGATTVGSPSTLTLSAGGNIQAVLTTNGMSVPVLLTAAGLNVVNSTTATALTSIATGTDGSCIMNANGTDMSLTQSGIAGINMHLGTVSIPYQLEVMGESKYQNIPPIITLTGGGPFNDIALDNSSTVYILNVEAVTTNAHVTGFGAPVMTNARRVNIFFCRATGGSINVILDHESASSAAAHRVWCYQAQNLTMKVNLQDCIQLYYCPYQSRWLVMTHET
jgi:hypothetical protein